MTRLAILLVAASSFAACHRTSSVAEPGAQAATVPQCSAGHAYCGARQKCIDATTCCTKGDCALEKARCHRAAQCVEGVCLYEAPACDANDRSCVDGKCIDGLLRFDARLVTPEAPYSLRAFQDGAVNITATLTNTSRNEIAVSSVVTGNISVSSIKTGTTHLRPTVRRIVHADSALGFQAASLRRLAPGAFLEFAVKTLSLEAQDETSEYIADYAPTGPGRYDIRLQYYYFGPDMSQTGVFHGVALSNAVSVVLH
ncbi:MAG: hypothetical protein JWN44_5779 [Myxococcales bacterium]|nr:hypothetical protein [Myxococcales bacterium]